MAQIQRILVPVDYSENSRVALSYGLQLTDQFGAFLTVLNVFQLKKRNHFQKLDTIVQLEKEAANEAKELINAFIGTTKDQLKIGAEKKLKINPIARIGFPVEEILQLTEQHTFDIVIMGQKGQESSKSSAVGSSTQKIIENLKVPILTIPATAKFRGIQRVVYFTNIEDANLPAIGQLLKFCGLFDAEVVLMHYHPEGAFPTPDFRQKLQSRIQSALNYPNLFVNILEDADLQKGLEKFNLDQKVDLLAVNAEEASLFRKAYTVERAMEMSSGLRIPLAVIPL